MQHLVSKRLNFFVKIFIFFIFIQLHFMLNNFQNIIKQLQLLERDEMNERGGYGSRGGGWSQRGQNDFNRDRGLF